jgi:hypothetical protein
MIPSMPALALVLALIDPTAQDVPTSGRNLPLDGLSLSARGHCNDIDVVVVIPVDASHVDVHLGATARRIGPSDFDLREDGRGPVRVLPRCKFDGTGVEVVFLFLSEDSGGSPLWSRQSIELDWQGLTTRETDARSVEPDTLSDWFL